MIIGLVVSVGLNIILSFFLLNEKISLNSTPKPKLTISQQEEEVVSAPVPESKPESEVIIEKEYIVLNTEVRKNDPSNDGWMAREWNGVYSNPERPWLTELSEDQFDYLYNQDTGTTENCPVINSSVSDSYVIFENEELSLRLPFNEKWGSNLFKLTPFVTSSWQNTQQVRFERQSRVGGEGWDGVGCEWARNDGFDIRPIKSLDEYISKAKSYYDISNIHLVEIPFFRDPSKKFIAVKMDVVGGFWDYSILAFLSDNHVYEFDDFLGPSLETAEDIISTIELK